MRYQDQMVTMTENALKALLVAVKAMPADKLEWKVEGSARSALDQLQEVAQSLLYSIPMLNQRKAEWDMEKFQSLVAERKQWETVEQCEAKMWANFGTYKAVALAFPDSDLSETIWLPFGKGFESTLAEILAYPYWNAVYHLGAINFIQTAYGDFEMHHD